MTRDDYPISGKLYEGTVVSWNRDLGFISCPGFPDVISISIEAIQERGDTLEVGKNITFTCRLTSGKPTVVDAFGPAIAKSRKDPPRSDRGYPPRRR
eukprot:TRINITY_DN25846_c0_g1_i1.p2 TRINITY_DN25846_c0_g1~~TRINITY_DN25846_c0_g1_i1.p2  ORF type:complete len:111 (+),score=15.23 TRINITY_DN25846_c0_g1_i1:43-333(+)